MSYDKPQTETYVFPSSAFGATTESRAIKGPKGKKGLVKDIRTYISADMVGTTTVPAVAKTSISVFCSSTIRESR